MIFNSLPFIVFIIIVFFIYWKILGRNLKNQNLFILISSYFFYGWWDYRFLSLLILSTVVDYFVGIQIYNSEEGKRKKWLYLSLFFNLGLLFTFKYLNFFISNFIEAFSSIGIDLNLRSLNIILPIGISFYTFQTLSYSLDISKRKLVPTKNFIAFASYVSFFPQLVAGPIERASNLLPQFFEKRKFNYGLAVSGMRLILWGFFKKIVIADNCAPYVDDIFKNYQIYDSSTLVVGVVVFAFQIYADFSGYSDIAIGVARLLGFKFKINFRNPYFATSISDFWNRWHISLSSWLNDYVFTPLAIQLRDYKKRGIFIAVFITFLLSGIWHGVGWNYILWGLLHGLFYLPIVFSKKRFKAITAQKKSDVKEKKPLIQLLKIILTFSMVCFSYIFFRAENIHQAFEFIKSIFSVSIVAIPKFSISWVLVLLFIFLDWNSRNFEVPNIYISKFRYIYYFITVLLIINYSINQDAGAFIYFQF